MNREWELHVSIRDARFLFTICQREPIERFLRRRQLTRHVFQDRLEQLRLHRREGGPDRLQCLRPAIAIERKTGIAGGDRCQQRVERALEGRVISRERGRRCRNLPAACRRERRDWRRRVGRTSGHTKESSAGGMLTVAPQFHAIPRLLAVVAAVFAVETAGLHSALARRVRTLLDVRHVAPPSRNGSRVHAPAQSGTYSTLRLPPRDAKHSPIRGKKCTISWARLLLSRIECPYDASSVSPGDTE